METKDNEKIQPKIEDLVADGKNKGTLVCPRCPSIILNARQADYKEIEVSVENVYILRLLKVSLNISKCTVVAFLAFDDFAKRSQG